MAKGNLHQQLETQIRTIVGSTDFFLRQIGKQSFHIQIPPGLCWRCPDHPGIDFKAPHYDIIPRLKEAFGIV